MSVASRLSKDRNAQDKNACQQSSAPTQSATRARHCHHFAVAAGRHGADGDGAGNVRVLAPAAGLYPEQPCADAGPAQGLDRCGISAPVFKPSADRR